MLENSEIAEIEEIKKKPGPAPQPKVTYENYIGLLSRVQSLEDMITKFASLAGQRNLSLEYGLKPWDPSRRDMSRYVS